ncbi:MAG: DUF1223 domain-containing protein [Planctomycetota bacterium]
MKIALVALTLLCIAIAGYTVVQPVRSAEASNQGETRTADATQVAGFAVVELFTSQGCSSCPPADRVLTDLQRQAREAGWPVYALSYHVDYWDRLGWTDPYASRQATERQYAYAEAFRSNRVYTPQMIVNGHTQFVGSRESVAQRVVQNALDEPQSFGIAIDSVERKNRHLTVNVALDHEPVESTTLVVAVVEPQRENRVARGENRGRQLSHIAVVRTFKQVPVTGRSQTVELDLPADADDGSLEMVAFLQDGAAGRIEAATRNTLSDPVSR